MEPIERDLSGKYRGRVDFSIETVHTDDVQRLAYFVVTPDARRYTIIERNNEKFYLDKYLSSLIGFEDMNALVTEQAAGLPIYSLSPTIDSAAGYAASRHSAIASELESGEYSSPVEKAVPHKRFEENDTPRGVTFLSVDICKGSALRRGDPVGFERAYKILLRELGTVVG